MASARPTVLVTGVSGDLGLRLPQQLAGFDVIGVDLTPPQTSVSLRFVPMNLEREECCHELMLLMRETRTQVVVHLAFVMDPVRTGIVDTARMWQINVAGAARVMETIAEVNRDEVLVKKFIFPSSALVYGPEAGSMASEDAPLQAHSLAAAVHQVEAEKVVRHRAPGLRGCSAYVLRPHIFAGASVENGLIAAFRGTPGGHGERADKLRRKGKKITFAIPVGQKYVENRMQFTHVDDVARLIAHIAAKTDPEPQKLTVLNVAGWGEPLTYQRCLELAGVDTLRLPGKWAARMFWNRLWERGISAVAPDMMDYLLADWLVSIERLRKFLGPEFEKVMRYSAADAFADSFSTAAHAAAGS